MRSFVFAAVSAFAIGAFALPSPFVERASACLTDADATRVAQNFKALINQPFDKTLAVQALTVDFTDYSDSVNELIDSGCPNGPAVLGTATFTSRAAFISGQSGQKPIPFQILNQWYNCNTVIIRWRSSAPGSVQPEEEVTGIIVLEVVKNAPGRPQPWKIQTVYSEFNSGAWLYDLGVFVPSCSASTKRSPNNIFYML
jgi:hypothetical protein